MLVKTHRRVTALVLQFHLLRCIFTGSLRRLLRCIGGGFRFPPRRLQNKGNGRVTLMSSAEGVEFLTKVAWGRFIVNADTMSVLW